MRYLHCLKSLLKTCNNVICIFLRCNSCLQADKIYKVEYFQGIFETTSKYWADKSSVLLPFVETDEFTVQIIKHNGSNKAIRCKFIEQRDFSDTKYSTLRNSFFKPCAGLVRRGLCGGVVRSIVRTIARRGCAGAVLLKCCLFCMHCVNFVLVCARVCAEALCRDCAGNFLDRNFFR